MNMKNKLNITLVVIYVSILVVFLHQIMPWTYKGESVDNHIKILDLNKEADYLSTVSIFREGAQGTYK